jgi:hypothetical protein
MLVTGERHSCLNAYLNIFYKYEKYLEFMTDITSASFKNQELSEVDFSKEYVNFLKRQELNSDPDRIGERYTFVNLTISLLEVLMKKRIQYEIENNWTIFSKRWRHLTFGAKTKPLIKYLPNFIPRTRSYQSRKALDYLLDDFSLIEHFFDYYIERENGKISQRRKNMINKLYDIRNNSVHELKDYDGESLKIMNEIKSSLDDFIKDMLIVVSTSIDTGNILFNKKFEEWESCEEQLCRQKDRIKKINLAIENRGCKICKEHDKRKKERCKHCIKASSLWYAPALKEELLELKNNIEEITEILGDFDE